MSTEPATPPPPEEECHATTISRRGDGPLSATPGAPAVVASPAARGFDFLTGAEAEYVQSVIEKLADRQWAKPLLSEIEAAGGLKTENKAKLFELRFGHALDASGVVPRYEVPGEGLSSIDFGFSSGGRDYLVEMMRLEETDAVKAATTAKTFADGATMIERHLNSDAEDARQTPEGETLMAVQRICQKLEQDGKPHKFPPPSGAIHVLLVDFRTFKNGGDIWDRMHIGLGGKCVPQIFRNYFKIKKKDGSTEQRLVSGVFDAGTTTKGAAEARERLHFIGFVNERSYGDGSFGAAVQFVGNSDIFKTADKAREALSGWPLGEPDILNARSPKPPEHVAKLAETLSALTVSEAAELASMLRQKWGVGTPSGAGDSLPQA